MFTPIKQISVVEEICKQITRHILFGDLKPGTRLPSERELAIQFAVSRSTIRESVRKLEQAGLVAVRVGALGGAFVSNASAETVTKALSLMLQLEQVSGNDVLEARRFLESATVRLAARRATEVDLQRISETLLDEATHTSKQALAEMNARFHEAIAEAACNKVLLMSLRAIRDVIRQSTEASSADQGMMASEFISHRRIYEAIISRDPAAADEAMARHLDNVELKLSSALERVKDCTW